MFTPEELEIIETFLQGLTPLEELSQNFTSEHSDCETSWDEYPDELFYTFHGIKDDSEKLYSFKDDDLEIEVETDSEESDNGPSGQEEDRPEMFRLNPEQRPIWLPHDVKMEEGESSQTKLYDPEFRKPEDYESERDYDRRNQPIRPDATSLPTQEIPYEYRSKFKSLDEPDYLDLDCKLNRKAILQKWESKMNIVILTNSDINRNISVADKFISHKLSGNVKSWFDNISPEAKRQLSSGSTTGHDYLQKLVAKIYTEFLGIDVISNPEKEKIAASEKAEFHLQNMLLCDICKFDAFYCEYEKYYHHLITELQPQYKTYFLNKLPGEWGEKCRSLWQEEKGKYPDTLGGIKRLIDEYIIIECNKRRLAKQLKSKVKICCSSMNPELPGHYGCPDGRKQSYKRKLKKIDKKSKYKRKRYILQKYSRKQYRRQPKSERRRKFFRRKKFSANEKGKYCPSGKAKCKCWLCQEEGHYANACPNKAKQNAKSLNLLQFVMEKGYEPIEDIIGSDSDDSYVYVESEDETSSLDDGSSSDTDTDSE